MLALSPPFFPTFGWPLEEPIFHNINTNNNIYNNNNLSGEIDTSDDSPISRAQIGLSDSTVFGSGGNAIVKKLNHNASERDRRKRINSLYSSLFSILPPSDQTKKLSIPATVLHVVKYIPELRKEVEELIQKKEELSSRISRTQHENSIHPQKKRRKYSNFSDNNINDEISSSFVTTTQINDNEIMIQISTIKAHKCLLIEALQALEESGLLLLNASSFQSYGQRLFHNLHLQVQGINKMDIEILREKLLSIYEKGEEHPF